MKYDYPELYDSFIAISNFGRFQFPGVSEIDVKTGINEDSEDLPGGDGTITKLSYAPCQVTVTNRVWTQEQYDEQTRLISIFKTRKGQKPLELEVMHPKLERYDISRLYCFDVSEPTNMGMGENVVTFQFREWWPEVRKNKTVQIGDVVTSNENVATPITPVSEQYDFNKLAPEIPAKN